MRSPWERRAVAASHAAEYDDGMRIPPLRVVKVFFLVCFTDLDLAYCSQYNIDYLAVVL